MPINQFENLVVQVDSTGTSSAYITKYFLNSQPIYNTTDGEYSFNINHRELTPIVYNNTEHIQNKFSYTGSDGCTVITLMCDYGADHPAGTACLANAANRNFYLSSDSSNCNSSGGSSSSSNGGSTSSSSGGSTPGGGSSGGTVNGIYTGPSLVEPRDPCAELNSSNTKPIANTTPSKSVLTNLKDLENQMATNPRERMFSLMPSSTAETEFVEDYSEGPLYGGDVAINMGQNAISVMMHCHFNVSLLSIFSVSDLQTIYQGMASGNIFSPQTFTSYLVTAHGTRYAIKMATPVKGTTPFDTELFSDWDTDINSKRNLEFVFERKVNQKNTVAQNELGMLKFLKDNKLGIEIYKASDSNWSQWSKLTIDASGNLIPVPCP